ncbi:peptidylprolyl isomerase [Halopseudomonas aestusnigri]|uniref:Peptidyl-prolyl cis-trans isomerase n=1 Tax=Halopseudomonas aestusnigri TaxID=857252 RepID=A0AAQ1JPJ8_9GAMM|nr:peptidylprolyl isomerase [Halopseudomonas aestusnigri]OWL89258.1 peptidylprolyl isomerase A [Halopseudomonas aestusnigri]SEG07415.1 peptidyl-prolyl cis-trans isomerase A (cyclophilin A) [Halopseudomonas aestusnigri]
MLKHLIGATTLLLLSSTALAENPRVQLTTNLGDIVVELNEEQAPISAANFLRYVEAGHYDGVIFHRVIPGFMIQTGGFDSNMRQRETGNPIKNEADNGLRNLRYTLAMARTGVVDSATSQFFINLDNNDFLDHGSRDFGYAVFGKVVSGEQVVETIGKVPTTSRSGHQNVPVNPVTIISATRLEDGTE